MRLAQQEEVPIEFWGWAGWESFEIRPPHRALWLPRFPMPEYRGSWLFARLAMRLRARRSAVSYVHITDPEGLTSLGDRKLLATVYDLIPLKQGIPRRRIVAWAGYQAYLRALRRVEVYFAISGQTAADLSGLLKVPASKVVVAAPGVEIPPPAVAGGGPERPYFLFVGGPDPNKNLAVLIDALALCRELPQELLVAGRWLPKQVAALEADLQARDLRPRVRHVGFVPDSELLGLVRNATAVVIPSRSEGFGLPVAEGLAAGAVVIHSRIPVLEQTSAGNALTFEPDSAQELAGCLRRTARDWELTDRLRKDGVQRAAALTWDAALERTLAAYGTLGG